MKTLTLPVISALSADTVPLVQLIRFGFSPTPMGLNTSNIDITYAGVVYRGAQGLGGIAPIEDSPGEVKGLTLSLNGAPSSMIALALDGSGVWQGTPVHVYTAVLDSDYQVVDVLLEWDGFGDVMAIAEDNETCTIQATVESSAVDLTRSTPLTYSNADHRALHPSDGSFDYVISQSDDPLVWPTREWFYK